MKKILTLLAIGTALSASAQTFSPAPGKVDSDAFPDGVNSVEVEGIYKINRNAPGYATISKDGVVLRQLPASNMRDIYTFQGFDKMETGSVHFTFFLTGGPACQTGDYEVYIPAGFIQKATTSVPLPALTASYTVSNDGAVTEVMRVQSIEKITLNFPGFTSLTYVGEPSSNPQMSAGTDIEFTKGNGEAIPYTLDIQGNIVDVIPTTPIVTPGKYYFLCNKGAFQDTDGKLTKTEFSYTYEIVVDTSGVTVQPAPGTYPCFEAASGTTMSGAQQSYSFLLTIPEDDQIQYVLMGKPYIAAINSDGTISTTKNVNLKAVKMSNTTIAFVNSAYNTADKDIILPSGDYAFVIPAGSYQCKSGGKNPEIIFRYTIEAVSELAPELVPDPAKALNALSTIELTYPAGSQVSIMANQYGILTNGLAVYTMTGTVSDDNPAQITFSLLNALEEAGEWEFSTPDYGFMVNEGKATAAATYTITEESSVRGLAEAMPEQADVFTMTGLRVATSMSSSELRNLPSGMYLFGGRKVVVK